MEKNKGNQIDLSFLKRNEGEDFGHFFERHLEGIKKLAREDLERVELFRWVMESEKDGTFEENLEKAYTILSIGLGKSPLLQKKKSGS